MTTKCFQMLEYIADYNSVITTNNVAY